MDAVAIDSGYLVVRDISYLDAQRQLQWGAFVAKLEFIDKLTVGQDDHQVWFAGSAPHGLDGKPIPNLGGGPTSLPLGDGSRDVLVQRRFSNKPTAAGKFTDFFEKIESYLTIISGPAMELHNANPFTFRTQETIPASMFKVHDTLTSRAEITDLSAKFADDVVAIKSHFSRRLEGHARQNLYYFVGLTSRHEFFLFVTPGHSRTAAE
jgi:hypothetical protein